VAVYQRNTSDAAPAVSSAHTKLCIHMPINMQAIQPHVPETDELMIHGSSAESTAWESCEAPVALEEVEVLLQRRQPHLFKHYLVSQCCEKTQIRSVTDVLDTYHFTFHCMPGCQGESTASSG